MNFQNRVIIVVGADQGVGPDVVRAFLAAGGDVFVETGAAGDALTRAGAKSAPRGGAGWADFFERCEQAAGRGVDVLIHSPAIVKSKPALDLTREELEATVRAELLDVIECVSEAARRMILRRRGRIISFVSMSGKTGVHKGTAAAAAAKGGLIAFSRSLAADIAATGVTVNCIATALFEPQVAHVSAEHKEELTRGIPAGRFGKPVEAAHAAMYLASDEAGFTTGETLNLSGGRFMD